MMDDKTTKPASNTTGLKFSFFFGLFILVSSIIWIMDILGVPERSIPKTYVQINFVGCKDLPLHKPTIDVFPSNRWLDPDFDWSEFHVGDKWSNNVQYRPKTNRIVMQIGNWVSDTQDPFSVVENCDMIEVFVTSDNTWAMMPATLSFYMKIGTKDEERYRNEYYNFFFEETGIEAFDENSPSTYKRGQRLTIPDRIKPDTSELSKYYFMKEDETFWLPTISTPELNVFVGNVMHPQGLGEYGLNVEVRVSMIHEGLSYVGTKGNTLTIQDVGQIKNIIGTSDKIETNAIGSWQPKIEVETNAYSSPTIVYEALGEASNKEMYLIGLSTLLGVGVSAVIEALLAFSVLGTTERKEKGPSRSFIVRIRRLFKRLRTSLGE